MRSLAFVTLLVLSAPAVANDATEEPKPEKAKKICRVSEAHTGTRMGRGKVCKTAEEWEAQKARDAASVRDGASRAR